MNTNHVTPRGVGTLLGESFALYRTALPAIFPLTLVGALFGVLPMLAEPTAERPEVHVLTLAFVVGVAIFGSLLFYIAAVRRLNDTIYGAGTMTLGEAVDGSWPFLLPMIGATVLYTVAVTIGLMLLVIPGLLVGVWLVLYAFALILDGDSMVGCLRTSARLVRGYWWRTFALLLVLGLLYGLVFVAVGMAMYSTGFEPGQEYDPLEVVIEASIQALVGAVLAPLFYVVMLGLYRDLQAARAG